MIYNSKNIYWIEPFDSHETHNVKFGFDNMHLAHGILQMDIITDENELPDIAFFQAMKESKPKLYEHNKITYAEIDCFIGKDKFKVIYYYDKNYYLVVDKRGKILKRIGSIT